jgi:5-methylthioribose kinase
LSQWIARRTQILNREWTRTKEQLFVYITSRSAAALKNSTAVPPQIRGARDEYRAWLLQTVQDVWREFADRFLTLWRAQQAGDAYHVSLFDDEPSQAALETERQRYLRQLFFDTVGFAGVKMIRRILGR